MTAQRAYSQGLRAGLLTGLGSSVADCIYACVGAFGLSVLSDFLLAHQTVINLVGGAVILVMGLSLLLGKKNSEAAAPAGHAAEGAKLFLSSFVVGITNPAAILTFLFAFSYFGIEGNARFADGILLVCGVFVGTYIWWTALSAGVMQIKKRTRKYSLRKIERGFGVVLILFSAVVFVRTLTALL